jgi:hypothetical protein
MNQRPYPHQRCLGARYPSKLGREHRIHPINPQQLCQQAPLETKATPIWLAGHIGQSGTQNRHQSDGRVSRVLHLKPEDPSTISGLSPPPSQLTFPWKVRTPHISRKQMDRRGIQKRWRNKNATRPQAHVGLMVYPMAPQWWHHLTNTAVAKRKPTAQAGRRPARPSYPAPARPLRQS